MRPLLFLFLLSLSMAAPIAIFDSGEGVEGNVKLFIYSPDGKVLRVETLNVSNGSWNYSTVLDVPIPSVLFKDYWVNGRDVDFPWGERKPIFVTQNPILLYLYDVIEGILSRQQSLEGDVEALQGAVEGQGEHLSSLEGRTSSLEERVDSLEEDLPRTLLDLADTPDRYREGKLLIVRDGRFTYVSPSALFDDDVGATNFLELADTPNSYAGQAGKAVIVNPTEDGLTFATFSVADEMVKADPLDPTAGYLSDKVDGTTLKIDTTNHQMYVDAAALASLINHNDLAGLQGGSTGEYYHLSQGQYDALTSGMPFGDGYLLYSNGGALATSGLFYDAANDRLGIGTTSPTTKLHVSGTARVTQGVSANSGTAGRPSYRFTDDADTGLFNPSANALAISTGATERVRIDSNGNVGIGTTTPAARLHVEGGELWLFNDGANVRFVIGDTPDTGSYGWLQWDSTNDYFRIDTSDAPSQGLKVKGNTVVVGNVYPDPNALLIVAQGTQEWARITSGGNVLLGNASGENVRLNVYAPQPMTPLRVEEEVDPTILLFGRPYAYRVEIRLNSPGDFAYNYSLLLNVSYQTGMRSDFGDLAFSWRNPSTGREEPIPYWVENYVASSYADVWVKVPVAEDGTIVYLYYGNPSVVDYGSPEDVFLYYDDFTTNKGWLSVGATGSWSISSGLLRMWNDWGACCNGACVYNRLETPVEFELPIVVELYFQQNPYTSYSNCGRTGPAVIFAGNGEVVTSTATSTTQGLALRMNSAYTNYNDQFPSGWHLLQVNFTSSSVSAKGDWMANVRSISSGLLPHTGRVGLAGDTDSATIYDEIDWIRVRRPGDFTYTMSAPTPVELVNRTILYINESRVGINTLSPQAALHVAGDVIVERMPSATGVDVGVDGNGRLVRISSSQRYKEDIQPLDVDSSLIYQLEPKAFRWKESGERGYGLIAEEVAQQIPQMVIYQNGQPEGVDYRLLTMLMLEELKKQREELEALKARVEELEETCGTGQ